jgi:hypothetical protein
METKQLPPRQCQQTLESNQRFQKQNVLNVSLSFSILFNTGNNKGMFAKGVFLQQTQFVIHANHLNTYL